MKKLDPSDRGILLGLALIVTGFGLCWPISWFRTDNSHWPLGWWDWATQHPRITADAAYMVCFLIALTGALLIRAVHRAEIRRYQRELDRRPLFNPRGHVRIKVEKDGVVTPFRRRDTAG